MFFVFISSLIFLFQIPVRGNSLYPQKSIVEHATGSKTALTDDSLQLILTFRLMHQAGGVRYPVLVHQHPKIHAEPPVYHIGQVGSIRADYLHDVLNI